MGSTLVVVLYGRFYSPGRQTRIEVWHHPDKKEFPYCCVEMHALEKEPARISWVADLESAHRWGSLTGCHAEIEPDPASTP